MNLSLFQGELDVGRRRTKRSSKARRSSQFSEIPAKGFPEIFSASNAATGQRCVAIPPASILRMTLARVLQ